VPEADVAAAVEPTTMEAATAVSATTMETTAAVPATTMPAAVRARSRRGKHGKAKRSARGDGQKGRFANHDALLEDPLGSLNCLSGHWSVRFGKGSAPRSGVRLDGRSDRVQIQQSRDKEGPGWLPFGAGAEWFM
jgi:hypothetical protein